MHLAASIKPQINQQIEALYQVFSRLSVAEKSTLMILAVVYKPIGVMKLGQIIDILISRGFLPQAKKYYNLSAQQKERFAQLSLLVMNKDGLQLNKLLANRLTSEIDQLSTALNFTPNQKLLEIIMAAEQVTPVINGWQIKDVDKQRVIRDLYYLNQLEQLEAALDLNKNPQIIDHEKNLILVEVLFLPFDLETFLQLPKGLQYQALATLIRTFQKQGQSCDYPIQILEQVCAASPERSHPLYNIHCQQLLAEQYLYQMRFDDFVRILHPQDSSCYGLQLLGAYCFLTGENQQAINYFEQAIQAKNKLAKRKKQYLNDVLGYFYKLALMVQGNLDDVSYFARALQQAEFEESDRKSPRNFYFVGRGVIKPIQSLSTGDKYNINIEYNCMDAEVDFFSHQLSYFNYLLAQVWCNQSKDPALVKLALAYQANFEQLAYPLFAQQCQQLAASFSNKKPESGPQQPAKLVDITSLIKTKSPWDLALDKLIALNPNTEKSSPAGKDVVIKPVRLIWEFECGLEHRLTAREQKRHKSGWSKGRVVSLKRLKEDTAQFDYLTDTDKRICLAIDAYQSWGYYSKLEYSLEGLAALEAAVGIDNLYNADDLSQNIEIINHELRRHSIILIHRIITLVHRMHSMF